jgi:hypothetical protein
VRKWSDPVDNGANLLIPVPGGADGPGGCLVCAENFIIYKNQDHEEVREARAGHPPPACHAAAAGPAGRLLCLNGLWAEGMLAT